MEANPLARRVKILDLCSEVNQRKLVRLNAYLKGMVRGLTYIDPAREFHPSNKKRDSKNDQTDVRSARDGLIQANGLADTAYHNVCIVL